MQTLFKGRYSTDEPKNWETFRLQLMGEEAGDWIDDPVEIDRVLNEAGYMLVKISDLDLLIRLAMREE